MDKHKLCILYIKANVVSVCVFVTDSTNMGQRAKQGQVVHVCKDQLPLRLHLCLHHHWMACLCLMCKGHLRTGARRGCPAWRCGYPPTWRCQGQQPPASVLTTGSVNSWTTTSSLRCQRSLHACCPSGTAYRTAASSQANECCRHARYQGSPIR
jgi:hypothetical protein